MQNNRYFLAFDFDGTLFNTGKRDPNGIGVAEAYSLAVKDVLGERGLQIYAEQGGLKNRAPSELAFQLIKADQTGELLQHARDFYDSARLPLDGLVPPGKGISLKEWDISNSIGIAAEMLVRVKLSYIASQIGDGWPVPMNGLVDLWNGIDDLRAEGIPVDRAIISSGHDIFIQQALALHNLKQPEVLVTEDDVRRMIFPREIERRVKPGEVQMALAHQQWLRQQGIINGDHVQVVEPRIQFANATN